MFKNRAWVKMFIFKMGVGIEDLDKGGVTFYILPW